MNRALWGKCFGEARLLLVGCALGMFLFQWVFVWISSLIRLPAFADFMLALPKEAQNLFGMDVRDLATSAGRVSMAYIDPVVLFISATWAIARGSDSVSGEIGRGTMEMLLAQPVRRISVLWTHAVVTVLGAAVLGMVAWLGTYVGLQLVELEQPVEARLYIPAAVNLFSLTFFLAGASTLASSWESDRWRTIGLMGGFYLVELVINVIARTTSRFGWLEYFTFFRAFRPQILVNYPDEAWEHSLNYNAVLLGMGLAAYGLATVIFCRRDLPAPL